MLKDVLERCLLACLKLKFKAMKTTNKMEITTIKVKDTVEYTSNYRYGATLFDAVVKALETWEGVIVDFDDCSGADSSFLNGFLGNLLERYPEAELKERVKFRNLSDFQKERFRYYVDKEKLRLKSLNLLP
jgi:hypothetical protein